MAADATIVALRKDVAKALKEKQFSQQFIPEEKYAPRFELEDIDQLHVTVFKAEWGMEPDNRNEWLNEYTIDIAIQYRAKAKNGIEDTPKFDELMLLEQEIAEYFQDTRPTIADCPLMSIELPNGPYYAPHIDSLNQFTAVVRLTFRKWR